VSILNVFLSHLRDSYVIGDDQLCKFRTSRKRNLIKHTCANMSRCQPLLIWQPNWINICRMAVIFKTGGKIEWRIKDFQKRGESHVNANSFSHSGCQCLRFIVPISFWKILMQKRCMCVSKSATEIVCLLIFQVTVLDQLYNFKQLALRIATLHNNLAKTCHIEAIKMAAILNILLVYFDCSFFSNYLDQFWTSNIKHNDAIKQSSKAFATWRPFWKWQPSRLFSNFEYFICLSTV
jgi:hypothetical protein